MNWLKNFKIKQKLLTLIAFCLFFIVVVGFVGFHFTTKGSDGMASMYNDRLIPVGELNQSVALLWQNKSNIFDASLDQAERLGRVQEIKQNIAKLKNILTSYSAKKLDLDEKDILTELKTNLEDYYKNMDELTELLKNNKTAEARAKLFFVEKNIDEVSGHFIELAEYNQKFAKELDEQADRDAVTAKIAIVTSIILAVLTALSIGLIIADMIVKPVNRVVDNLKELSDGNLKVKDINVDSKDETGVLANALNTTVATLKKLVSAVAQSAEDISASSEEMSASSEQTAQGAQQTATSTSQLAQGAQEISGNVEQGAANINKMNKAVQNVSEEAKIVAKLGNDTETNANAGTEHVKKAVNKIDSIKKVSEDISINISELGKLSSEIEQIVDLIKNIAGQTNLLALNAAIEAARAGEHGKGFAVVADEVKKLAGQSAGATEKITAMIKEIQNKTQVAVTTMGKATKEVEEGVFVINDAGTALENIIKQVKTANVKIQGITKEIDGVAVTSEEMVKMIENISAITEETAASAEEISSITEEQTASLEEISASAQTLAAVAEVLTKQVSVFKI